MPGPTTRYCTSDHKRDQIRKVMTRLVAEERERNGGRRVRLLNVMGLRAGESPDRAKRSAFRHDAAASNGRRHVDEWLPILRWDLVRVWDRVRSAGTRHHPAYDAGMSRLSCSLCILASRKDLVLAASLRPALAREYLEVEERIGHDFREGFPVREIVREAALAAGERGEVAPIVAEREAGSEKGGGKHDFGQRSYAERLGVTHGVFRLAHALARARAEGRELSSSAFRMPLVQETSKRIAPPTRVRGRSPEWDPADVERFEQDLQEGEPGAAPTPPRRTRGRPRKADPVLSGVPPEELRRGVSRASLGDTAARVFSARYGLDGRDAVPTTLQLADELGISRQAVWEASSRAERKVRRALEDIPGGAPADAHQDGPHTS